VAEWLKATVC